MKIRMIQNEREEGIDITSLIDVVFLLVIFFMVTSTFIEESKVYKITLPRAEKPVTVSRDNTHTLSLTVDGKIYLKMETAEEELETLEDVVKRFQARRVEEKEILPVLLRVDAHLEYSAYVQAKNALRLAGAKLIFEEVEVKR